MSEIKEIKALAPAKINLHLAVGRPMEDGYHPISSIFQKISLADEITITVETKSRNSQTKVNGLEKYVKKGKSSIDKAIGLWRQFTGYKESLTVNVKKKIPVQSGLGGGSSDAATVLKILNSITENTKYHLTGKELLQLGIIVGCDVPFFLYNCDAATVFGLGERVYPIEARHDLQGYIVQAKGEKVSTKVAYGTLNERKVVQLLERRDFLEKEYYKPFTEWNFRNDFELVNKRPNLEIQSNEKLFLTGSGSAWVLLTNRENLEFPENYISQKIIL